MRDRMHWKPRRNRLRSARESFANKERKLSEIERERQKYIGFENELLENKNEFNLKLQKFNAKYWIWKAKNRRFSH